MLLRVSCACSTRSFHSIEYYRGKEDKREHSSSSSSSKSSSKSSKRQPCHHLSRPAHLKTSYPAIKTPRKLYASGHCARQPQASGERTTRLFYCLLLQSSYYCVTAVPIPLRDSSVSRLDCWTRWRDEGDAEELQLWSRDGSLEETADG